jgi:hypothetical protein
MRTENDKMVRTLLPVLGGAGCMIILLAAMNAVTQWRNAMPHVGDMVAFTASEDQPLDGGFRLVAQRPSQFGCALDLNILQHSGGSFVIEGQVLNAANMFKVHWAGERTTTDSGNCGDNADLLLDAHELDVLSSAARGINPVQEHETVALK